MKTYILKAALIFFLLFFNFNKSESQTITTVAGSGVMGYGGDGGPATSAKVDHPYGVAVDGVGNIFISDNQNHRIRKVSTTGIITTIAGTGLAGYSGDGGPSNLAQVYYPFGIAVDAIGNVFIADHQNHRIRKINTSGIISTVAGGLLSGYSGDGGPATSATLTYPIGVTVDASGNLFIADYANNAIRKVNTAGIISTIAGTGTSGYSGDGGIATAAQLSWPYAVAVDGSGNVYIADRGNARIRIVNTSGVINTFAGNGIAGFSGDGGLATLAKLSNPIGVTTDGAGNVYISDSNNNRIRKINSSGIINTFAGNGTRGFSGDGGAAIVAQLADPFALAIDGAGNIFVADTGNQRIRKISLLTGINEMNNLNQIKIYPNPNNGLINIDLRGNGYSAIKINDVIGLEIYSQKLNSTEENLSYKINICDVPNGVYFIELTNSNGKQVKKFVKE